MIHNPVRESADVDRVIELESTESLAFRLRDGRANSRRILPEHIPLIGFSGAPFTLASYAIEGGGSRNFLHTKTLMYRAPDAWRELMERLSRSITRYLNAQIAAGAQAVQLFDSWVGCLSPDDYRAIRPALRPQHCRRPLPRRSADPLRHRQPVAAAADGRSRRRRDRRRLAHRPRRRLASRRPRPRRAGQPRPHDPVSRPRLDRSSSPRGPQPPPTTAPATFSISATACCSKRRSTT